MNRASKSALLGRLMGTSSQVRRLREVVEHVAAMQLTVLITGESGTGKELVATLIHELGPRAAGPLVKINCSAVPDTLLESELFGHARGAFTGAEASRRGKFEEANGGTLLLDEIGDISPKMQVSLLRALESGEIQRVGADGSVRSDTRVVAATNLDLAHAVGEGVFREDLYYRLNVLGIHIPPLRDRREDIVEIAEAFLRQFRAELGKSVELSPDAADELVRYPWPGNVRELKNVLLRAVAMVKNHTLRPEDLAFSPPGSGAALDRTSASETPDLLSRPLHETLADVESRVLEAALEAARGNVRHAASLVGVSRSVFYTKIRRFGLG